MTESIIVAAITAMATVVCQVIISHRTSSLTVYRIDQLEEKVNKHNNLIERTYKIERRLDVDEEKLKVANHRIDDLEGYHK